jgi:hypothetical protein
MHRHTSTSQRCAKDERAPSSLSSAFTSNSTDSCGYTFNLAAHAVEDGFLQSLCTKKQCHLNGQREGSTQASATASKITPVPQVPPAHTPEFGPHLASEECCPNGSPASALCRTVNRTDGLPLAALLACEYYQNRNRVNGTRGVMRGNALNVTGDLFLVSYQGYALRLFW